MSRSIDGETLNTSNARPLKIYTYCGLSSGMYSYPTTFNKVMVKDSCKHWIWCTFFFSFFKHLIWHKELMMPPFVGYLSYKQSISLDGQYNYYSYGPFVICKRNQRNSILKNKSRPHSHICKRYQWNNMFCCSPDVAQMRLRCGPHP